ncbi:MAG: GGDEF domain-containing protein [Stellaceae bacterium]
MKDGERKPERGAVVLHLNARRKGAKPGEEPADARAILARAGLSEAALTPVAKRTLGALAASRGSRRELNAALSRIGVLERLVGDDQPVPVRSRRAFLRELARMAAFADRYGMPASLVYFDIEDMKGINGRHGHGAGDAVLEEIGRVLVEHVRMSDMVGRLGGDEFGVLLMRTDASLAERKAQELAAAIAKQPIAWQGKSLSVGVAFGIYAVIEKESASGMLGAAARALRSRKSGPQATS